MREVLFDFEEFKKRTRRSTHQEGRLHYSFTSIPSSNGFFTQIVFSIYSPAGEGLLLVFEKHEVFSTYDSDAIRSFSDDCINLTREVDATPGYYEGEKA